MLNSDLFLSAELSSPRSVTSSRSSYGLPSPFGSAAYPGVKTASTAPCVDHQSPCCTAAVCSAGPLSASQPLPSPLPSSAVKDEANAFPSKKSATSCMSGERQVCVVYSDCQCLSGYGVIVFYKQLPAKRQKQTDTQNTVNRSTRQLNQVLSFS